MTAVPGNGYRRRLRPFTAAAAVLTLAAAVRFAHRGSTPRIGSSRTAGSSKSVATLEKIRIGGSDQWVLERSEDISNPIVLYLHGGPGTSQLTLNRRNTRDLERFFTIVNWDQRGAGKSYAAIRDGARMTIEQFVEDTRELSVYLLRKFGRDRLVLVGHSWGTVIGALTVSRYPELYCCYVGIGQVAHMEAGLIWFDRSAHMPNSEERGRFNGTTVEKVLPIAARSSVPKSPVS